MQRRIAAVLVLVLLLAGCAGGASSSEVVVSATSVSEVSESGSLASSTGGPMEAADLVGNWTWLEDREGEYPGGATAHLVFLDDTTVQLAMGFFESELVYISQGTYELRGDRLHIQVANNLMEAYDFKAHCVFKDGTMTLSSFEGEYEGVFSNHFPREFIKDDPFYNWRDNYSEWLSDEYYQRVQMSLIETSPISGKWQAAFTFRKDGTFLFECAGPDGRASYRCEGSYTREKSLYTLIWTQTGAVEGDGHDAAEKKTELAIDYGYGCFDVVLLEGEPLFDGMVAEETWNF